MRVSSNSLPDSLVNQLQVLNERQNRLQSQAASGQRIQWAAEDPSGMATALDLQNSSRINAQYSKNIDFLKERTTASVTAVRGLNTILDRANEIAVLADGAKSPKQLRDYAGEVDQLIRQAVQTGNTRHRGDSLFAGTKSDQDPFVIEESATGTVARVNYQGNADTSELEISANSTVVMQVPGSNASGSGSLGLFSDSRSDTDVFGHLIALREHLIAGDSQSIAATDRGALVKDEDNVLLQVANMGAVQARLESAGSTTTNRASQLRQAYSQTTDVDLADTLVQLSATQTAYKAALQSGANLLNVSLMDYLH